MRKKRVILIALIVFVVATFVGANIVLNGKGLLKNFNIISLENNYTEYKLKFDDIKAAKYYRITIIDENNNKVFEKETNSTEIEFELTNLQFGMSYELMVFAYDSVGDYRAANKAKTFIWEEPSIDKDVAILKDQDYVIAINGDIESKYYDLIIKKGEQEIQKEKITTNEILISKQLFAGEKTSLEAIIKYQDKVIDSISLYNNINPITPMKVISPSNGVTINYNDVTINYEGGENAESYLLEIYDGKNLIKKTNIRKKHVILSKSLFKISKTYRVVITASIDDYKSSCEVNFTMSDKEQLKPVYISSNWKYVKKGSFLTLKSNNTDAKIYYTTDGTNPESFGTLYKEPIVVDGNMTLKTVAVNENKYNSIISTYEINTGKKDSLVVYLSPSNQHGNYGVLDVGYTNERDEMNDLTDYIQERLTAFGVKVVRNNSSGNINLWLKESAYAGADLHLAIHSNASNEHDKYGIETWIDSEASKTFSLANKIQNNLMAIYPYSDLSGANRGVKYAAGALGEVNDNYLPFGILIEVAHHDYKNDAEWMIQNKKLIGYNIADSVLSYYQIIS